MKRIRLKILFAVLALSWFTTTAEKIRGDVNCDHVVTIHDVTALIDELFHLYVPPVGADCNLDGRVNITDVTTLIDYLLSGTWGPDPEIPDHEGDWVDLGLPSGTLWATMNLGASSPEEYGDYFAWGESTPNCDGTWELYKWCYYINHAYVNLTKYCFDSEYGYEGFVDDKPELDPEDDAAYVRWGPSWRMPSVEQLKELKNCCTRQGTTMNGVNGVLFTGPNGNTMFVPKAGYIRGSFFYYGNPREKGAAGYYWSRTLDSSHLNPQLANYMYIGLEGYMTWLRLERSLGFTVRAVRASQD